MLSARAQLSKERSQYGACGGSLHFHRLVINRFAVISPRSQNLEGTLDSPRQL